MKTPTLCSSATLALLLALCAAPVRAGGIVNWLGLPSGIVAQSFKLSAEDPQNSGLAVDDQLDISRLQVQSEVAPLPDPLHPAETATIGDPGVNLESSGDLSKIGVSSLLAAGVPTFEIIGYELSNPWLLVGLLALSAAIAGLIALYRRQPDPEPPAF